MLPLGHASPEKIDWPVKAHEDNNKTIKNYEVLWGFHEPRDE